MVTFFAREGTWLAGHGLNPNRGVKPGAHTACMRVCAHEDSQSPNLRSSSARYPHWLRHRWSRSPPSDQISTTEPCGRSNRTMIYHHHARQALALLRTLLRVSMTSPSPSVTVKIRLAGETTSRDGRPRPLAQAGTSYVAN